MIVGIGTDIVHVARIQKSLLRHGAKFARRVLTEREFDEYSKHQRPENFVAKRFAAKEATAKALGTGFSDGLSLRDIGICHDKQGKPLLEYSGRGEELKNRLGICSSHISIADEQDYAIAFVTLLGKSE